MDFAAEEELCQQAYEVWLHYACRPATDGEGSHSGPPARRKTCERAAPAANEDGPCSVLPLIFSKSGACFFSNPSLPSSGLSHFKAS